VRSFSPVLRELLVSDILIRFCERIPYPFAILWTMNYGKLNAQQFGYLVAIEMVTARRGILARSRSTASLLFHQDQRAEQHARVAAQ